MNSIRRQYLLDSMRQIKEALGVEADYESKSIYLKKGEDILGLHGTYFPAESGLQLMEAWCNAYSKDFKFLGSIYRIFGPIEDEASELKKDGWVEVTPPVAS